MLKDMYWLSYSENVEIEIAQSFDEGKCVDKYKEDVKRIRDESSDDQSVESLFMKICDDIAQAPLRNDYPFDEPSDLDSILKARPESDGKTHLQPAYSTKKESFDKIYGAWLGRCCGCLLGQPIENWPRDRIVGLLKDTDNYPVSYYISSDIPKDIREKYDVVDEKKIYGSSTANWINNVSYMPEDDDTNYTLIALKAMELHSYDFTPEDMAEIWLDSLPFAHTCTAERIAYRNFTSLIEPPASALFRNPFREWIGAQIRADLFGYVTPGDPQLGAELAWRDALISHSKNGIYGAMYVAAMLSHAAVSQDIEEIIQAGLNQIPKKSRLHQKVTETIKNMDKLENWEAAINALHEEYNEEDMHDWCHTIPNAVIVTFSLLYGDLSLEKSIGIAIAAGFDTDCNGATVGSIIGMIVGAEKLPEKWTDALQDKIKSGVDGMGLVKISDMALRTVEIMDKRATRYWNEE